MTNLLQFTINVRKSHRQFNAPARDLRTRTARALRLTLGFSTTYCEL